MSWIRPSADPFAAVILVEMARDRRFRDESARVAHHPPSSVLYDLTTSIETDTVLSVWPLKDSVAVTVAVPFCTALNIPSALPPLPVVAHGPFTVLTRFGNAVLKQTVRPLRFAESVNASTQIPLV
jgi:hypothetical protein